MKIKKVTVKWTALLLLLAMAGVSIPFHHLFHKHREYTSATSKDGKAQVRNQELPCCKILQIHHDAVLHRASPPAFISFSIFIPTDPIPGECGNTFLLTLNKAPPEHAA